MLAWRRCCASSARPLSEGVEKPYTYDEAVTLITTALAPLGNDYIERLRAEMDPAKGSIDLLPYADKRFAQGNVAMKRGDVFADGRDEVFVDGDGDIVFIEVCG